MARVLLVEDDHNMRFLLAQILNRAGYETFEAENGRRALGVLKENDLDLVISDFLMPEMNGLEFLELVQKQHPEIPLIMLSVHTRVDWVDEAMQKGAVAYLLKPFTREQLTTIVSDILSTRFPVNSDVHYTPVAYAL